MMRRACLLCALALLAGCAQRAPVLLQASYAPPASRARPSQAGDPARSCRLHIGEIRDLRSDPTALGEIGGRPVRAVDVPAWLRSGLLSLDRGAAIVMVENAEAEDVDISADIHKTYVISMPTSKAADVAFTIHYRRNGAAVDDQVYRGSDEGMNWASGEGEGQSALNRALADALTHVEADVLAHCAGRKTES